MGSNANRELTTWSEIAGYLAVTERTAQLWRRDRNLPVRKVGGRVTATTAELDDWKERQARALPLIGASEPEHPGRSRRLVLFVCLCLGAALCGLIWPGASRKPKGPRPVRYEFHGNILFTFNQDGTPAWSHMFDPPVNQPRPDQADHARSLLEDLDGDGARELLFLPWGDGFCRTILCFRPNGARAWEAAIGRDVVQGHGNTIGSAYTPTRIAVLKKPRPDGGRIVLLSHHRVSWPALLQVFTIDGKQAAEYWHPGWLFDMVLTDLDGDGVEEIAAAGVNNSLLEAGDGSILLVLDSAFETGQGPVRSGDHRYVRGVPAGRPAAAILFPNLPNASRLPDQFTRIARIDPAGGGLNLYVDSDERHTAEYRLDARLKVTGISLSPALAAIRPPGKVRSVLAKLTVLENRFAREAAMVR